MKTLFLFFFALIVSLFAYHSKGFTNVRSKTIVIPKDTVRKTFEVKGFHTLKVKQGIIVEVHKSDEEKAVATSNHMDFLKIHTKGDKLIIKYDNMKEIRNTYTKVILYAKNLNDYSISSGADVQLKDIFTGEKQYITISSGGALEGNIQAHTLTLNLSSSGSFKGNIESASLHTEISSAGNAEITGKTTNAKLNVSSAGSFLGNTLDIENVLANVSSSGKIEIKVAKELNTHISSSGSAEISGKATNTEIHVSSGGCFLGKAFETDTLFANASSGGKIEVKEALKKSKVNISSGGKVHFINKGTMNHIGGYVKKS